MHECKKVYSFTTLLAWACRSDPWCVEGNSLALIRRLKPSILIGKMNEKVFTAILLGEMKP